ncbi:MAG TPA: PorP/SprF family type IX secretion system membrane protein [Bacteroidia bacterium]|jgi:type IX secretion system PorP/SprF family membrane protein
MIPADKILKRIQRYILCAAACISMQSVIAQDVHFSQFNETPQLLNPGATGVYNGYMRAIVNYKNQWMAMGKAFNTSAASFDIPLFDYNEHKAHLGAGLNFFSDKAGDSQFGLTQVNLCLAGILPVSRESQFSAGISVGGAQHKANLAAVTWGNQYNGTGFDPALNSTEAAPVSSFGYLDLGAGLYYEYFTGKATLDRNEAKRLAVGVAYYHINRPTQKYFTVSEKLYGKMVATVNGHFDRTGTKLSIRPSAMYVLQGPSSEITVGCALRYRLKNGTKITGFINETGISIGVHYRVKDAVIPQFYLELGDLGVGLSYDINLSSYREASKMNGGAEVSLKYFIQKGALFKQKRML